MYPEPLQPYTARTITGIGELGRVLAETRKCGYAVDDEEYVDGIRCIASPILNEMGFPIAAIGISGPKLRLPKGKITEYGQKVKDAALNVSLHCGYQKEGERTE
jgi:IclR family transcriptional regulator, acetate operon repressor